jgi:SAM-dependent methyltransferase
MTPSEIAKSYDQLAKQWNSDEFPRGDGIEQHKRAIAFLKERRHALDVGCGSSGRIIDFLISHGFDVEGLDISSRMIELAKQRHPHVTFHHADICAWEFPRKYDFISAWDSVWHVPLRQQEPVLKKILHGLTPGGVYIYDRRAGHAVRKSGLANGPADVLQRPRDSQPAETYSRGRMHLQAPGIRSISGVASVHHCAEDLATVNSGPLPRCTEP